jgi:hypothetical protein
VAQGALRLRLAAALTGTAAVVTEIAAPAGAPPLAALDATVGIAFAAGAAATAAASPRVSALALMVAAAWTIGTLTGLGGIPAPVATAATLLHRGPLCVLILVYPGGRLHGSAARGLAVMALLAPLAPGGSGPAATATVAGFVAVAVATAAARATAALRAPRVAAATAGSAIAATAVLGAAELGSSGELLVAYDIVLLATAAGLLAPLAAGRWSAAAATGLVIELGAAPPGAPVTTRLAEVLLDPGLELRLQLPGGSWTDEAGCPVPPPDAVNGDRALTRHRLGDGTEVVLLHDPAAVPDPATAEAAVAVAAVTVANAHQDRAVQARIAQLERLRRGLVDAVDEERRQLEAELRSGPLRNAEELARRLLALPDEQSRALHHEVALVRTELAAIARGLYPDALLEHGLADALAGAVAGAPTPVAVHSELGSAVIPREIALTAYYVASEALVNVAKHAPTARARIDLSASTDELVVRVIDDGAGGADPDGDGLAGLRDRVAAVGGQFSVRSAPNAGTAIEARLPLAAPGRRGPAAASQAPTQPVQSAPQAEDRRG